MFQRGVLALLAVLVGLCAGPARAISIQTISPSQCVWHEGDNQAWAMPDLDESGWKPLSSWKVSGSQPSMWVRCHADLTALRRASQPALQVNAGKAYQLFLNGKMVGQNGNISKGGASINPERNFSIAQSDLATGVDTIALRMKIRREGDAPAFVAGEAGWLRDRHNSEAFTGAMKFLPAAIGFGVIGVLGFILLALYLNDRSHLELLPLALICWGLSTLRVFNLLFAAMAPLPYQLYWTILALGSSTALVMPWFIFRLADRKVPLLYKLVAAIFALSLCASYLFLAYAPANISLWADTLYQKSSLLLHLDGVVMATAAFAAFWPWNRIPRGMRAMAGCAMLWGIIEMVWFMGEASPHWHDLLLELRAFGTMSAIIALIALLFREYRRNAEERAVLSGEMQAAQQIQRILAPVAVDTVENVLVEVAFRPMRDVGGDFYLCRALPDGRQRVLLGDVSGKGAAAAMTATLLIGAAEQREADSPAELLQHLDLVLHASRVGGFATCLCADLTPNGAVTLANAGHLSPYLHGEEIATAPGLPLGLSASQETYEERRLHLPEGETLTFLSDGVVEARSVTGELFGFERTEAISAHTAEAIADAAEQYGQQDDITVLTLTRAPKSAERVVGTDMLDTRETVLIAHSGCTVRRYSPHRFERRDRCRFNLELQRNASPG